MAQAVSWVAVAHWDLACFNTVIDTQVYAFYF